ncbi:MAG: hypothetical protein ABSG63_14260 [Spirochaetia bacterium]|jgi:mono/diheme cytochrome c family protein
MKSDRSSHHVASTRALVTGVSIAILLFCGAAALIGEQGETAASTASSNACVSGMKWTGGDSESPEMHPGGNCIECHASGEGPRFLVAGTVYRQLTEPNDCYGVEGAVVQLTDAKGRVKTMKTNRSGNFMLRVRGQSLAMPFTAQVKFNGQSAEMATPQSTGNCAACHTSQGVNGAPGRIIIPGG